MTETREEFDDRIKRARAAHEKQQEGHKTHAAQIQTFGSDAMKAPAIVGLGGIVALLGFYSANFDRLSRNTAAMQSFGDMLFWLFASLLMTVAAPGFAYLSQIAYTQALNDERFDFDEPFVHETTKSKRYRRLGDVFRWAAVVLVILSIIGLAIAGVLFFRVVA